MIIKRWKAVGGGAGSSIAIIVIWLMHTYFSLEIPEEVKLAIDALIGAFIGFVVTYFFPRNKYEDANDKST